MLAFARMRLGLTPDEFFTLVPRMLTAYYRAWENEEREQRILFGLLRMDVINSGFCRPEKPVQLGDLVPDWKGRPAISDRPRPRMTKKVREEIANSFRRMFSSQN